MVAQHNSPPHTLRNDLKCVKWDVKPYDTPLAVFASFLQSFMWTRLHQHASCRSWPGDRSFSLYVAPDLVFTGSRYCHAMLSYCIRPDYTTSTYYHRSTQYHAVISLRLPRAIKLNDLRRNKSRRLESWSPNRGLWRIPCRQPRLRVFMLYCDDCGRLSHFITCSLAIEV